VSGEYERVVSEDLRIAWYARYFVDMPADKDQKFRSSLASGIAVSNQPDFDKLDSAVRFEIAAGYNFRLTYDLGLKLGINTRSQKAVNIGSDFRCQLDTERQVVEWKAFLDFGREISLRPFIGVRKTTETDAAPSGYESFKRILIVGIVFFKWF
jgi:hypothetical protein